MTISPLKIYPNQSNSDYILITFWLISDFILTSFWLHSDYILTSFWLHSDYILTIFWVHSGYILTILWLHSGYILFTFWLWEILRNFGKFCHNLRAFIWGKIEPKSTFLEKKWQIEGLILATFLLTSDCILTTFWLHSDYILTILTISENIWIHSDNFGLFLTDWLTDYGYGG